MPELALKIIDISPKNPPICGSGKHFIDLLRIEKAFTGEGAIPASHKLEPQHEPKPHKYFYEQIVYIMSGTTDFHVANEVFSLTAGSKLILPLNTMHYAEVVGDEDILNLDIFTPTRAEFFE